MAAIAIGTLAALGAMTAAWIDERERREQARYDRGETELVVVNDTGATGRLSRAGKRLNEAVENAVLQQGRTWLVRGNYFFAVEHSGRQWSYPVPILGYRSGPDADGTLVVTVRAPPGHEPPHGDTPKFVFVPGGHFLLGDRLNPREAHYVWLTGFFISPAELTNAEFAEFLRDPEGWQAASNWTDEGQRWKTTNRSQASARLTRADKEYSRFGRPELPVTGVTWFEAVAYCRWLTRKAGEGRWIFALPTDAEWEKAARGPDSFDYGLSMTISDNEVSLYNWKKNLEVPVTVVEARGTGYTANRYGLFHMSGNVAEWTQSVFLHYHRALPYADDDRNHDNTPGRRSVRGGSWYSATSAPLYLPYRDSFQPEHRGNDVGFRVVARLP